jgi:tellurium resistance protein TerZ
MAISLSKGQRVDLTKSNGKKLTHFCVGVNWGAIETQKKKLFGGYKTVKNSVDLDLSCVMMSSDKETYDHLYSPEYDPNALRKIGLPPGKLVSQCGALRHSGDDRSGDMDGDDGLDNEIISVNLKNINKQIDQIFFFVNNVGQEDFAQIPFAKIRMYEGTPTKVDNVHATFDIAADPSYQGKRAMIMGKLYKKNGEWKFAAIGEATNDVNFAQTLMSIIQTNA